MSEKRKSTLSAKVLTVLIIVLFVGAVAMITDYFSMTLL